MKKIIPLLLSMAFLQGCLKDETIRKYTFYRPLYKTSAEVRAEIRSNEPEEVRSPGKIFYKDGFVFLNELHKGVHIIDVRNTKQPRIIAFVKIPGNVDMAVRGDILYADMFTDLVAIDISDPLNVKLTEVIGGVFPDNYYLGFFVDSGRVITDWIRVDTTVREDESGGWMMQEDMVASIPLINGSFSSKGTTNGIGGSMARFALSADRLYTVSSSDLKLFNTAVPAKPAYVKTVAIAAWDIETIFPYSHYLFIGSMTGMYIFDASDKDNPVMLSKFDHARVCDPVISDGAYAYVTLRNGTECGGFTNQLDVLDIASITSPALVRSYAMTNPHGLAKSGDILLICEGAAGLKILDAKAANNINVLSEVKGFHAYDVIVVNGVAIVSALDGLYLVEFTDPRNPAINSSIKIKI